jgi:ATP/maltotriose-dependent transcriptional regulator MalT
VIEELGASADFEEAAALGLVTEAQAGTAAFRHALVREAVYADGPWPRRRDAHRRVASSLARRGAPARLVAEHWLAGGENDLARGALVAAADASCGVHAYRDAATALRKAMELCPEGEDEARLDLAERLARCAERAGELREAAALWEAIIRELDPSELVRRAEAQRSLGTVFRLLGNIERAGALRAEAAEAFTAAGAFAEAAEVRLFLAWNREKDPLAPFDVLEAAARDARRAERPDLVARARGMRAHFLARRGHFDEAAALAREALELARSTGVPSAIYDAYFYVAAIGVTRADYGGAVAVLEEAADFCRANGLRSDEEFCVACIAKILMKQGEWDRSLELADGLLESGDPELRVRWAALWTAGLVRAARGRTSEGRPLLEELTALGRRLRFDTALIEGLHALALADEVDGDFETAADRGRELIGTARAFTTDAHHFAPTLRWAAAFFASLEDAERVNACADVLAGIAERFGSPDALAALAHTLGEASLLQGDASEAADQFGRAIALLEQADMPFEAALTKLRAGPAFVAAGERDVGVDCIVDAYRCFRKLGAKPYAARAAAVLEELGERVDRRLGRRAAGELERGGLTRRELEVLRLVAVGRTNAEIARELVLSPRTVEMHVRHTLAKLDCRSRTEATARAHTLGLVAGAATTSR